MKTNLKKLFWCVLCAFALDFVTGCVVDHDRGGDPDYYGHGHGEYHDHDWDHDHYDHDHWH